jgi:hypothetical protein
VEAARDADEHLMVCERRMWGKDDSAEAARDADEHLMVCEEDVGETTARRLHVMPMST